VDISEESLEKMNTTDLEANRENSEDIEVHQEVLNVEAAVD
jgi:hypothetical protein